MSKPDSDADDTSKNVDDPKEVSGVAPTLDQVHIMNQAKVEEEDATNGDDEAGADGKQPGESDSSGDADAANGDGSGEDNDTDTGAGGAGKEEDIEPETPPVVTPEAPVDTPQPAPQLDTDTTKPGEGKIAVVDAEGKTHYFNNRDEMPNDFEPASYKALMNAASEFAKKETREEQDAATKAAQERVDAEAAETKKRTDTMQQEWERDATDLSSAGLLPKDPQKLEAAKTEVYDYIEAELKKGNVISNFKQAYKSMMYDKEQESKVAEQKKINQLKKDRGAIVQGGNAGGAPTGGSSRGKVIEAPPQGVGLDAVHNRAINSL